MIPILTTEQVRSADAYTIEHEPIASIDLMERASNAFVNQLLELIDRGHSISVFCGVGNNGGDGLAVGRILLSKGFPVSIFIIGNQEKASGDFRKNLERYPAGHTLNSIEEGRQLPRFEDGDIVIDAIFGSGLSREPKGIYAEVIHYLNNSEARIVSIDIASGLFADKPAHAGAIVQPWATITFQMPKLVFMLPDAAKYVGEWYVVDIGLHQGFVLGQSTSFYFTQSPDINALFRPSHRFMHKGDAGRLLLAAGKRGSMGAALLSGKAAMRSGCGLLMLHVPLCGLPIVQVGLPEAMAEADIHENCISEIVSGFSFDVLAIGPGIGQGETTRKALMEILKNTDKPVVIDADAINIIADNKEMLKQLPVGAILTPHPGEFRRLVGEWSNDFEKLDMLVSFCKRYKVHVVLKGAFSAVCSAEGKICFNPTGNPGMATAGSGDVLTGMVAAFLARGYERFDALRVAVYLHGLAGDLAAERLGTYSLMASDIIDSIPDALISVLPQS